MLIARLIYLLFVFNNVQCQFDEIFEKIATQTLGIVNFALLAEEDYHDRMHLLVKYHFYTKDASYELFSNSKEALQNSTFNKSAKTIIVIHGYTDSKDRRIIIRLRESLVENLDSNIIVVDWHKAAYQIYFTAVRNTLKVGYMVGEFLEFLECEGVDLENVHIIGHSLGAQIAGIAGYKVNGKLGRITALDPAGPLFEFIAIRNSSISLDPTDAHFVDVIHTAIGTFGAIWPLGHADFYPNGGGVPQPGCEHLLSISCSHIRSIEFFIESINGTKQFLSKRCLSWNLAYLENCLNFDFVPMGYHLPLNTRGSFYVQTTATEPFAMNGKFLKQSNYLLLTEN